MRYRLDDNRTAMTAHVMNHSQPLAIAHHQQWQSENGEREEITLVSNIRGQMHIQLRSKNCVRSSFRKLSSVKQAPGKPRFPCSSLVISSV